MPTLAWPPRILIRRWIVCFAIEENCHGRAAIKGMDGGNHRLADLAAETCAALSARGALHARAGPQMARQTPGDFRPVTAGAPATPRRETLLVKPYLRVRPQRAARPAARPISSARSGLSHPSTYRIWSARSPAWR